MTFISQTTQSELDQPQDTPSGIEYGIKPQILKSIEDSSHIKDTDSINEKLVESQPPETPKNKS